MVNIYMVGHVFLNIAYSRQDKYKLNNTDKYNIETWKKNKKVIFKLVCTAQLTDGTIDTTLSCC